MKPNGAKRKSTLQKKIKESLLIFFIGEADLQMICIPQ
jgi:hypothetical protein